ncbi:M23 family peptidase [Coraliomargarita sinensis]|uniref:M23 family peptidase n=1 Tax=Coraliomargarita sinensis TaxID=2174842 RepID=A0A317ZEP3_9BACT|nr:M23 family metallopeptidase [Coraliomargarita sinensis]PXA03252.1 M23 family peptidase [Coraliomargarita sinensis]
MSFRLLLLFLSLGLLPSISLSASASLIWPTPNQAFQAGKPIEAFVQPTSSGRVESGLFGCVRNGGAKFHEGLDLFPVKRSSRGEALDPVYSILPGKVVHISRTAGYSSYGRYIVVVHNGESPSFHSLYAHMASINSSLKVGSRVEAGTELGIMGRSAAGYSIPRSRSHLHLELGFRLSDQFQTWFDRQRFGSKNRHGNWNGMNLVSVDPLDFYRSMRQGEVSTFREYLRRLPVAARVRVHSAKVPNFVQDYPALVTRPYAGRRVVAWDIAFTEFGVPKEWTPRFAEEKLGGRAGEVRVLTYNPQVLEAQSCRRVIRISGRVPTIAPGTVTILKKLFGFK